MKHGTDCHKMEHRTHPDGGGYLHAADDDAPYNIDGQLYCGRCHYAIDYPDAIEATMTSFTTPDMAACEYERLERREIIAMRAQRDRAIAVLAIMVFHFGNPKRDEWLNDEGFEAAKAAVDAARKLLKGQ